MFETAVRRIRMAREQAASSLDLTDLQLTELPEAIAELDQLEVLDLRNNKLHDLPEGIANLTSLRILSLEGNEFPRLPVEIRPLKQVEELSLGHNLLEGLPEWLREWQGLKVLNISRNELEAWPAVIWELTHLEEIVAFKNAFDRLPPEISRLKRLRYLNVIGNEIAALPDELGTLPALEGLYLVENAFEAFPEVICQLHSLRQLNLGYSKVPQVPEAIGQLKQLQLLDLKSNGLTSLPDTLGELSLLEELNLRNNAFAAFPLPILRLGSLQKLRLEHNQIPSLPEDMGRLQRLTQLGLDYNPITALPESLGTIPELKQLYINRTQVRHLPFNLLEHPTLKEINLYGIPLEGVPESIVRSGISVVRSYLFAQREISENILSKSPELDLSACEYLEKIPPEVGEMAHLKRLVIRSKTLRALPDFLTSLEGLEVLELELSPYYFGEFPALIFRFKQLRELTLRDAGIRELPLSLARMDKLDKVDFQDNPIQNVPPEVIARGWPAIRQFLVNLERETLAGLHEAKLIVVGSGGVGKTTLTRKLIDPDFDLTQVKEVSTEGIDIRYWEMDLDDGRAIRCNIWDFGGQEIYHATHQFFLTKRSLYLFVTEARKEDNYLDFDYWLNIIRLLSEDSPVLIVLNKSDERLKQIDEAGLKERFPNIAGFFRVSCLEGTGLEDLTRQIIDELGRLPHVTAAVPESWIEVRRELERLAGKQDYLELEQYLKVCEAEGLDEAQAGFLSDYLHDLGVILHFREDIVLNNTVILRPDWGTHAVYNVLDTEEIIQNYGAFTNQDLRHIWQAPAYPPEKHPALLALMRKFELCFQVEPSTYLAPQLLPLSPPTHTWDPTDNLRLEYHYPGFMPAGLLARFLVRMHHAISDNLFWKHGMVLGWEDSRARISEDPILRKIRIQVQGGEKQTLMGVIRHEFDHLHRQFKGLVYEELIPCLCEECITSDSPQFFPVTKLRKYQQKGRQTITCDRSVEEVQIHELFKGIEGAASPGKKQGVGLAELQEKIRILFLAANPLDTTRLRLGREVREIEEGLRGARLRERFELVQRWAVRPGDLQQAMLDYEPRVVHFSGHGLGNGTGDETGDTRALRYKNEDISPRGGLVLEDEQGLQQLVSAEALANLFSLFSGKVDCVIMNACYSDQQARAMLAFVPFVVGMQAAIPDDAAIAFSRGFYDALGAGKAIEVAYAFGVNAIELHGVGGNEIPVLRRRVKSE